MPRLAPANGPEDVCFRTTFKAELFPNGNGFRTIEDVREFLTHLLVLMTKGRVSPRRAAVLAYVTTQLLHSHCVIQKEEKEELANEPIIFDLPCPKYDDEETAS